ncbi:MAG TPA: class I SAM-dependent methyltransferase [Candidatus Deferrimicrobiaceae bacterium]
MEPSQYAAMRMLEGDYWWYRSLRSLALRRIGKAEKILDAGCGTGGMLERLRDRRAVGIDFSPVAISHARTRGGLRLCAGSVCGLPFRSASFDAVLALDVIYHEAVPDDALAVAECARVLRPGGDLIVQAPAYGWLAGSHDRETHGVRRYTVPRIRELVESAGLRVRELSYRNLVALPFAIAGRRLGLRSRRDGGGSDLRRLPGPLNALLAAASFAENACVGFPGLPAGLSVWCVARKPS